MRLRWSCLRHSVRAHVPFTRSLEPPPTPRVSPFPPPACLQYKFGLHRYVGQRVRLWSEEAQDWKEGVITSFGQK